jgi:hypothetical protein
MDLALSIESLSVPGSSGRDSQGVHGRGARLSAARFRSLLANRNMSVEDVSAAVSMRVSISDLVSRDLEVEFQDIQALAPA